MRTHRKREGPTEKNPTTRERDKDPEKNHHPAHTRTRYNKRRHRGRRRKALSLSFTTYIIGGKIWKLPSSTISSLPRFLLFYCSSIYFGCCRREHRSIQMMMKYHQDFNSTLLIVFDAARHSKRERTSYTSQEKDAEQKIRQEQFIPIPWTANLWISVLDFDVFHLAGTGRGQSKQQKTGPRGIIYYGTR